ncbi:MAG TPA: hypothetical protein VIW94_08850 [Acidimicrobiia bacterium]
MARKVDTSAAGCLASLFTLLGFFMFGAALFNQFQEFTGDGVGFELSGALIPGLVLLAMGGSLRRRANAAKPDEKQVRIPLKPPPQSTPPQQMQASKPTPRPQVTPPVVQIAGLPEVEEVHEPGALPAVEDLRLEDFEPEKPMTSEERLRIAKEKYRKKP